MKTIKLMPDYGCFPLWKDSSDDIGNINPDSLPISEALKAELLNWASEYDATLDHNNPSLSGFRSKNDERNFEVKGKNLHFLLQEELGESYFVRLKI
jgi:hypothetical protein